MSNWAKVGEILINIWLAFMAIGIIFVLIAGIVEPYMFLLGIGYALVWYSVYRFMKELE